MTCNPNVPTIKNSQGEDNLNKIMGSQKSSFNKEGTCFNPLKEKKCYKNLFVKLTNHESRSITCNYCANIGHTSTDCRITKMKNLDAKKDNTSKFCGC